MSKFVKYKNYWWEYDETSDEDYARLFNHYGGLVFGVDIRQLKRQEAEDFKSLDWTGTNVLDNTSRYGWLDRDGKFYGCSYADHNNQARLVHHMNRRDLEKLGWIHISQDLVNDPTGKPQAHFYGEGVLPTDEQLLYLSKRNDVDCSNVLEAFEKHNEIKDEYDEFNVMD